MFAVTAPSVSMIYFEIENQIQAFVIASLLLFPTPRAISLRWCAVREASTFSINVAKTKVRRDSYAWFCSSKNLSY